MKIFKNFLIITSSLCFLSITQLAFSEVAVIVNPSNNSEISEDDVKRIFLGKLKTFPDGTSVLPVNLSNSDSIREEFDDKALGKSASQIKAYWSKLVFSGKGNPPKEVDSQKEILQLVKDNPAVIGYVNASSVPAGVKVIAKF